MRLLNNWLETADGFKAKRKRQLFVHEGEILFMWIGVDTIVREDDRAKLKEPIFAQWEELIYAERNLAPKCLQ